MAARSVPRVRRAPPVRERLALVQGGDAAGRVVCADDLPDGLVLADHTGRVTVFNRAATRLTGIAPADAIGGDIRDVLPLRDRDGRDWWACTDPYGGLNVRARHPEVSLSLPGGDELLVTVSYIRDRHHGHRVRRLAICLRGATGLARLERSRADLVSTVAHELRSPLTSVKGFTATLLAKWHRFTDDQKRVMLETVNADADRVTRLITELLDVSRIEAGRLEVHRQVTDIAERAGKVIAGRIAAGESLDRFQLTGHGGVPEMWLDPDKIDQILGNLIENALRHGDGTVTIEVQAAPGAGPGARWDDHRADSAWRRCGVSIYPARRGARLRLTKDRPRWARRRSLVRTCEPGARGGSRSASGWSAVTTVEPPDHHQPSPPACAAPVSRPRPGAGAMARDGQDSNDAPSSARSIGPQGRAFLNVRTEQVLRPRRGGVTVGRGTPAHDP